VLALDEDVDGLRPRRTVGLSGATVVPGFNDAHCHPVHLGVTLAELDLSEASCRSLDEVYALVAERARLTPPGGWITGARYDQNKLGGHPQRAALDLAAPGHLVWLKHTSGHMCVVNSRVLEATGLLAGAVAIPEGGVVDVDSGRVEEQAQPLVRDLVLPLSEEAVAEALGRASSLALSQGVTSWTDAGVGGGWIGHSAREIGGYIVARDSGRLGVRTNLMVTEECLHRVDRSPDDAGDLGLDLGIRTGFGDDRLRVGPVKFFTDGSLIGRTAALRAAYADDPANVGYLLADAGELTDRIVEAHLAGWQVAAHAIGDRAVDVVLDAVAKAQGLMPRADARHRIEHAGIVSPDQLERIVELDVIPVPQGEFIGAVGDGMAEAIGESRIATLYRQRSFIDAGLTVPGSSDRPVVPGAPLIGIRDLVLRRTASGHVLASDERLEAAQALAAWTIGSAYAENAENSKGTLAPGMLADFVALAEDPLELNAEHLPDVEVVATFVGGECRYRVG
jgi:predicted amidohydrolase YtcJ